MVGKGGETEDPVGVGSIYRQHDCSPDLSHKCKVLFLFNCKSNLTNNDDCFKKYKFKIHRLGI